MASHFCCNTVLKLLSGTAVAAAFKSAKLTALSACDELYLITLIVSALSVM